MAVPKQAFSPKSVAVIGASRRRGKVGHEILRNFVRSFKGKIYCVNPKAKAILGKRCFSSVAQIPGRVELAVVATPASAVPKVLEDCVKKKVRVVIIITSGFGEIGEEGKRREQELKRIISGSETRVIGPNCMGVISKGIDTNFNPLEKQKRPPIGNIAFLSQSGAVGSTIIDWLAQEGIGISAFVSYGNQADLDESDFIEYFGSDKETKVITMYLEGVKDGKKFIATAKKVSKTKPILVIKAGKTESGTKAVASHTGALAGASEIYSGAFRQCGAIEVNNWEELFDSAVAFATQPLLKSPRIAIITDGGGFGVLAADEAERQGLKLTRPPASLLRLFKRKFPPYALIENPIDLTGDADCKRYETAIEACLRSPAYSGVVVIALFQLPSLEPEVSNVIIRLSKKYSKPLIVCSTGSSYTQRIIKKLEANKVPVYPTPQRAIKALASLYRYFRAQS